jgi:hypothetical protein
MSSTSSEALAVSRSRKALGGAIGTLFVIVDFLGG